MRSSQRVRVLVAATVAGLVFVVAACGQEQRGSGRPTATNPSAGAAAKVSPDTAVANGVVGKSAEDIFQTAKATLAGARFVHVKGTFSGRGVQSGIDMRLARDAAQGTVTGPHAGKSYSIDIIRAQNNLYIRSAKLWRDAGGAVAGGLIGNRWVLTPANSTDFAAFRKMAGIESFAREILGTTEAITKEKQVVIDGRPAIGITDSGSVLYVATTGKPYPLKIVPKKAGKAGEEVVFLDYDVPFRVTPPANAINLGDLQ